MRIGVSWFRAELYYWTQILLYLGDWVFRIFIWTLLLVLWAWRLPLMRLQLEFQLQQHVNKLDSEIGGWCGFCSEVLGLGPIHMGLGYRGRTLRFETRNCLFRTQVWRGPSPREENKTCDAG